MNETAHEVARLRASIVELEERLAQRCDSERKLRESEQRLRAIFDHTSHFIGLLTPDGTLLEASLASLRMAGVDEADVLGRPFWMTPWWTHSPEQQVKLREAIGKAASGESAAMEAFHPGADGTTHYVDASVQPVRDESGRVVYLVPEGRDITARKRLETQLRHAHKLQAIGQLAAGVAHDFNSLLMVILGNAQLLEAALRDLAAHHDGQVDLALISEIHGAVERGQSLVKKLLAFGRAREWRPRRLNLNEHVTEVRRVLDRVIKKTIACELDLASDLRPIEADGSQIEQVLMNLVLNACDAMPDGGTLTIETANVHLAQSDVDGNAEASTGPHVRLTVCDTGTGIDQDCMGHIFDPFFSTKTADRGSGLGLSIVHGIVKQAHGHISVESDPGVRTRFRLYFPPPTEPTEQI